MVVLDLSIDWSRRGVQWGSYLLNYIDTYVLSLDLHWLVFGSQARHFIKPKNIPIHRRTRHVLVDR
jgi:hypothetical protein